MRLIYWVCKDSNAVEKYLSNFRFKQFDFFKMACFSFPDPTSDVVHLSWNRYFLFVSSAADYLNVHEIAAKGHLLPKYLHSNIISKKFYLRNRKYLSDLEPNPFTLTTLRSILFKSFHFLYPPSSTLFFFIIVFQTKLYKQKGCSKNSPLEVVIRYNRTPDL